MNRVYRPQTILLHDVIQSQTEQSGLTPLLQIFVRTEDNPHRLQISLLLPVPDHLCQALLIIDLHPLRIMDDDGSVMDILQQPVFSEQILKQIIPINTGSCA